jgi:hypothetical protein
MEKTPLGTAVGVDDPYDHVERCDHVTDDGNCRYAYERDRRGGPEAGDDERFVRALRERDYACPVVSDAGPDWAWADCPQFRCTDHSRECARCGLTEVRMAHDDDRPLLEEHHLSYRDDDREDVAHEVTVVLCRWCHAKVHDSFARIDDEANPPTEALAEREARRSREREQLGFESAADRYRE